MHNYAIDGARIYVHSQRIENKFAELAGNTVYVYFRKIRRKINKRKQVKGRTTFPVFFIVAGFKMIHSPNFRERESESTHLQNYSQEDSRGGKHSSLVTSICSRALLFA